MRLVREAAELGSAVAAAQREAASSFGDGTVFAERYVERPRHVEVQIVGDAFGKVVELGERDCSVQRRYQKLIEESPSPIVDPLLRERFGRRRGCRRPSSRLRRRRHGGVRHGPNGQFYFLEMNTRLQVEHPVTELVTGLDLVWLQLQVAEGRPLPPEVRGAVAGTRSRRGCMPRTWRLDSFRRLAFCTGSPCQSRPACGWIPALRPDHTSAPLRLAARQGGRARIVPRGACRLLARTRRTPHTRGGNEPRPARGLLHSPDYRAGEIDVGLSGPPRSGRAHANCASPGRDRIHALVPPLRIRPSAAQHARVLGRRRRVGAMSPSERQWTTYRWRCGLPRRIPIHSRRLGGRHGEPRIVRRRRDDPRRE